MNLPFRRRTRGSVPTEYAALASLLGVGVFVAVAFPTYFGEMLVRGGNNMEIGHEYPIQFDGGPPVTVTPGEPGDDGDDDGWADPSNPDDDPWDYEDPWSEGPGHGAAGPDTTDPTAEFGPGSVATILLTLSDPHIPRWVAAVLTQNLVRALSSNPYPRVLVVLDDNHHGEDTQDPHYIISLLEEAGIEAVFMDEPPNGLAPTDIEGFDIVWLSNPGYPTDDALTLATLEDALERGVSVVLQGDDMTFTEAPGASMLPWTDIQHIDNGTWTEGVMTDNNAGANYRVFIGDNDSAVIEGLEGFEFLYGNDIDHGLPIGENEVLAYATLDGSNSGIKYPVIIVTPGPNRKSSGDTGDTGGTAWSGADPWSQGPSGTDPGSAANVGEPGSGSSQATGGSSGGSSATASSGGSSGGSSSGTISGGKKNKSGGSSTSSSSALAAMANYYGSRPTTWSWSW